MMKSLDEMKRDLARLLIQKSYMEGDFTLSSGLKSDYYFDCRQTSLHPDGAWLIGHIFTALLQTENGIDGIGGMTMGADPLITATSLAAREAGLNWPGLIVRKQAKKHGTGQNIEGMGNFKPGMRVILLEDVVSTGGSVLKACESVRNAGLVVDLVACVLDRDMGGKEALEQAGCRLYSVFDRLELVRLGKS